MGGQGKPLRRGQAVAGEPHLEQVRTSDVEGHDKNSLTGRTPGLFIQAAGALVIKQGSS